MSDRNLVHYEEERNEHGPYWTLDIDRSAAGRPGLFFTIKTQSYAEADRDILSLNQELTIIVKDGTALLAPVLEWLGPDIPYEEPAPEENFWDDRTTPLAYSESDSIRDMEARREIAEKLDSDFAAGKLSIINGWLVADAGKHTCGAGPGSGAGHEPYCGWEPLTDLASQMVSKVETR